MANFPIIRDELVVNQAVQDFYNSFDGDGAVFLLARVVRFANDFPVLEIQHRPLVIIADQYIGTGGRINASGSLKPQALEDPALDGANGADARFRTAGGQTIPVSAGKDGRNGHAGRDGQPGCNVTLMCRSGIDVRIDASGTSGTRGGNAGRGGNGGDGWYGRQDDNGAVVGAYDGTHGGRGGSGGAGGNGGSGGVLTLISASPIHQPTLINDNGAGGEGGKGAVFGQDGRLCPDPIRTEENAPWRGTDGAHGVSGNAPPPAITVLPEAAYGPQMLALLDSDPVFNFANFWAPFRIAMGEYHFRQFKPEAQPDDGKGRLAAAEFKAALLLQNDNPDARRLLDMLEAGLTPVGQPRDVDVVPEFERYLSAFTDFAPLISGFFNQGLTEMLVSTQLNAIRNLAVSQKMIVQDALASVQDDLGILKREQKDAISETEWLQQQLDQVAAEIRAAMATMREEPFSVGDVLGVVAGIAEAVVAVIGAIPSAGASLVALVPAVISLTSAVMDTSDPVGKALFKSDDKDVAKIKTAYEKVDKDVKAVVAAGKAIVNFVTVIQKLDEGKTEQNAPSVELVKRGVELAHQLLLAKNQVAIGEQKRKAHEGRVGRLQQTLAFIASAEEGIEDDALIIRSTGLGAIEAALAQVDTLLSFAFFAARSLKIYTLAEPPPVAMDAGRIHPDLTRAYSDGMPDAARALVPAYQASWNQLLQVSSLQAAYLNYLRRPAHADTVRLSFTEAGTPGPFATFKRTGTLPFTMSLDALAANGRETKVRGVAVALVGARTASGVVSCQIHHGSQYLQFDADGRLDTQLLEAKYEVLVVPVTPLMLDGVDFGENTPLSAPLALSFWGRGVGGQWSLRLPAAQPHGEALDLTELRQVQVWIGYQFAEGH
ncbi:hypothetical protein SAMN05216359_101380 [Roseateles sp. YR242]|uniref:hypothetical protein n=1 Tax=Roseateles sp. YR242 TaxID=1855305 RepID=UPI0008B09731|nr:hypothetical protein [Roseateles sp. YR242]SEK31087.1 hypothetical protein SAMN05216359_101380 [Roseateles sp. YR242]